MLESLREYSSMPKMMSIPAMNPTPLQCESQPRLNRGRARKTAERLERFEERLSGIPDRFEGIAVASDDIQASGGRSDFGRFAVVQATGQGLPKSPRKGGNRAISCDRRRTVGKREPTGMSPPSLHDAIRLAPVSSSMSHLLRRFAVGKIVAHGKRDVSFDWTRFA